jgi:ABC-type antimicrobial peptide transport system permease subunit
MKYILAHKYAYLNFEDAKAYAKIFGKLTDEDLNSRSVEEIVGYYVSYILQNESGTSFTPSSSVSFDDFFLDSLVSIYNTVGAGSANKMLYSYTKYYAGTQGIVKNIKIVGISGSADDNDGFIVVGDEIASTLINQKANGTYSFAVGNMPENLDGIRQNVRFSNEYEIDGVKFILKNNVTEQLDWIDEMLSVLGRVFLYVGIGFAVFASLMLSNFIGTSVAFKKQEIGILRAIGSRSNDVFRIFFAEAFIIAMINYVLSVVGTLSVTLFINSMLRNSAGLLITFLNFGIRQVALLLAVSLFVAVISTFIPVKKIASMKPIDAIKNRK